MTPELSTEELQSLHKEATDLYDTYFRSNAKHKVNVSQDIAMNIFKSEFLFNLDGNYGHMNNAKYAPYDISISIETVYIIF